MATNRPRPSTRSASGKTTGKHPKEGAGRDRRPARAHRDDTPEARTQRARAPKTHPGTKARTPGARRKNSANPRGR